jgi:hypothetical protein
MNLKLLKQYLQDALRSGEPDGLLRNDLMVLIIKVQEKIDQELSTGDKDKEGYN